MTHKKHTAICIKWFPCVLLALICNIPPMVLGQANEAARIEQQGSQWRVVASGVRPVEAIATALRGRLGVAISVEDPVLTFAGDLKDASLEHLGLRAGTFVPRGGTLDLAFHTPSDPAERNARAFLTAVVTSINDQWPVKYRLDEDGDRFTLVPFRQRDEVGTFADIQPLLDVRVSIPSGARSIAETAHLMSMELSKHTKMTISCCESFVAGIPWGMGEITFGASEMPAREVLKHLIAKAGGRRQWVSRCDRKFCFIDLY